MCLDRICWRYIGFARCLCLVVVETRHLMRERERGGSCDLVRGIRDMVRPLRLPVVKRNDFAAWRGRGREGRGRQSRTVRATSFAAAKLRL
jgi:hypothetical protein